MISNNWSGSKTTNQSNRFLSYNLISIFVLYVLNLLLVSAYKFLFSIIYILISYWFIWIFVVEFFDRQRKKQNYFFRLLLLLLQKNKMCEWSNYLEFVFKRKQNLFFGSFFCLGNCFFLFVVVDVIFLFSIIYFFHMKCTRWLSIPSPLCYVFPFHYCFVFLLQQLCQLNSPLLPYLHEIKHKTQSKYSNACFRSPPLSSLSWHFDSLLYWILVMATIFLYENLKDI